MKIFSNKFLISKLSLSLKVIKHGKKTCDHVKKAGQKKFEILEKAGQSWVREKLEKEYQEGLRNKEIIDRMMEIHMNDFEGYEEFQPSYKPKEN